MNYWHYTFLTFHYLKAGFRRIFCKRKPTTYRYELSDLFSARVIFVPHGICEPVFAQTISLSNFPLNTTLFLMSALALINFRNAGCGYGLVVHTVTPFSNSNQQFFFTHENVPLKLLVQCIQIISAALPVM